MQGLTLDHYELAWLSVLCTNPCEREVYLHEFYTLPPKPVPAGGYDDTLEYAKAWEEARELDLARKRRQAHNDKLIRDFERGEAQARSFPHRSYPKVLKSSKKMS